MVPLLTLNAREPRHVPRLPATEEGLLRLVQASQHILEDVAVDGGVLRHLRTKRLQLGFLLIAGEGNAPLSVEEEALLQCGVIERAAAPRYTLPLLLLHRRGSVYLSVLR